MLTECDPRNLLITKPKKISRFRSVLTKKFLDLIQCNLFMIEKELIAIEAYLNDEEITPCP